MNARTRNAMTQTYTTKEIAESNHIHVNTVRFYEEMGFITKPARRPNGYRVYTALQLSQCALIRLAMRAEVLQNGLRSQAVEIVRHCAALDFNAAKAAAAAYGKQIEKETQNAKAAIASVEKQLRKSSRPGGSMIKRSEAAKALGITSETLRTWERSGLISVKRRANGYRVYAIEDMERLNIIRTLRCANYSLSSILRLLHRLDSHATQSVEDILNTPEDGETIVSVCDKLILSLQSTAADAQRITKALQQIEEIYCTLQ